MGGSSLRFRLGFASAAVATLLAMVTALSISVLAWQSQTLDLEDDVTLAAFVAAEADDPIGSPLPKSGRNGFAFTLDDTGEMLETTEPLPASLVAILTDDIWSLTTVEDEVISAFYDESDGEIESEGLSDLVVSGLRCVGDASCDTVIVGAYDQSLWSYFWAHLLVIVMPVLAVGVLVGLGARWLVGRSLLPVDRMRGELAEITASNLKSRLEVPSSGDELSELGDTFNQTITRLEAGVNANERFVADAAHELRSPIAGVRAAVELEATKNRGGILDDALIELDRVSRMIDDLLVLARRGGSFVEKAVDVDLDDLARAEVQSAKIRFTHVEFSSSIEPVRIQGHPDGLRRIVSNLVENACLHGHNMVRVVVASGEDGPRIEVHDDGPGVPAAETTRIFERFARLDDSRSRVSGGSGLGLAIVKELAADHGATVAVLDSDLGGARFVVSFRRKP